ncbi:LuxR C-terminal-related transcriptional regulator [Pseudonocardia hydrocarbonoxydans]|uniref:LuxR family transcriptional regulator n=1 Tax=Pseudonocardia hydrocarbonoxydans TaxID=76726 RepID=A0A4Y3WNS9_9PSEU|nr:LuxR C-terminal-related transcriptional regulator [Pseudonocardia hydrocarbonoxydans]GEC20454.1 LuxR family transcriptional regulator [Pseudonocardia hydrocarbonoxydans]
MKTQVPRLSPRHQRRARLLDALDAGGPGQVTVVSAPAGFGKTQLLAEWVATRPEPVAWVSLDEDDNDDRRFWAAVLTALGSHTEPGSAVHRLVIPPRPGRDPEFLAAVAGLPDALPEPVLLVLDDVHELTAPAAVHGLAALVRDRSPGLRLVLAGRTDPPVSIARLRLNGDLCEIRAEQLRFRLDEAEAKLSAEEVDLRPDQVRLLVEQTEGWAAGLRLAAISLRAGVDRDRFLADLAGNGRVVADYLVGEILSRLAPDEVEVLRAVSICDRVPVGLAAALALRSDAGDVLEELEQRTALVVGHGTGRATYRTQALLRAHLHADLRRRRPDLAAALHVRAAAWFAEHREPDRALGHARTGGQVGQVTDLLGRFAVTLLSGGHHSAVRTTVAWLVDRGVGVDHRLGLLDALAAMEGGTTRPADDYLAEAGADADPEVGELYRLVRSRRAGLFVDAAEMELASGPPPPDRAPGDVEHWALDAMARLDQAFLLAVDGRSADAHALAQAVLDGARRRHHGYLAARALAVLAAAVAGGGEFGAMTRLAEQAGAELPGSGWAHTAAAGLASTLRAYGTLLAADPVRALEFLDAAPAPPVDEPVPGAGMHVRSVVHGCALCDLGRTGEGLAEMAAARAGAVAGRNPPRFTALVAVLEHGAATAAGHTDQARAVLGWAEGLLGPSSGDVLFLHARRHVASGRTGTAASALAPVLDGSAPVLVPWVGVEARVVACRLALHAGRRPQARRELGRALALAAASGALRPLTSAPPEVIDVLVRYLGGFGDLEPVAARILRARTATGGPGHLVRLTDRERDVLSLLPTQRSLGEIAAELTVSHSTVKTHVKAIYTKLDARSRREAVTTARRQGLLASAP